jgi:hypothetical protein
MQTAANQGGRFVLGACNLRMREAKTLNVFVFVFGQNDCAIANLCRFQAAGRYLAVTGGQPYAIPLAKFTKGRRAALPLTPVFFGVSETHRKSSALFEARRKVDRIFRRKKDNHFRRLK